MVSVMFGRIGTIVTADPLIDCGELLGTLCLLPSVLIGCFSAGEESQCKPH